MKLQFFLIKSGKDVFKPAIVKEKFDVSDSKCEGGHVVA
jgi:hypothetical protein